MHNINENKAPVLFEYLKKKSLINNNTLKQSQNSNLLIAQSAIKAKETNVISPLDQLLSLGNNSRTGTAKLINYSYNKDLKIINSLSISSSSNTTTVAPSASASASASALVSVSQGSAIAVSQQYENLVGEAKSLANNKSAIANIALCSALHLDVGLSPSNKVAGNTTIATASCCPRSATWYLVEDLQKVLISYFKSVFSLISKAKYKITNDVIKVEILYYITIPDANIFTWYNIIYNKNNKITSSDQQAISSGAFNTSASLCLAQSATKAKESNKLKNKINFIKRKNKLIRLIKKNRLNKEIYFKLNLDYINNLYKDKFFSLVNWFNSIFNKPIQLELIRLHHSDSDSNILTQLFFLVLKKKNIRSVINKLFSKNKVKDINLINFNSSVQHNNITEQIKHKSALNNKLAVAQSATKDKLSNYIPVFISGLYIHIGGRLMREPIIPRMTTKKFEKGAIALGKVNSLETTQMTKKNKKGAYTVKITFAQNIV